MSEYMRLIDANSADVESIDCYYADACRLNDVQEWLNSLPTIHPGELERKAVWKVDSNTQKGHCSRCNEEPIKGVLSKFCPNCGARMRNGTRFA